MKARRAVVCSVAAMSALFACSSPDSTVAPLAPGEALLAKPPAGPSDPTASFLFPTNDPTLGVLSDGQFTSGTNSVYADGECGVKAKIFATEALSNSGDATMQTNNPASKDRRCTSYPRTLTVVYGHGDQQASTVFINLREIANTTYQIPLGATVRRALTIQEGRCERLAWRATLADGTDTNGADSVNVTRVNSSTWLVESQPYPDNEAYCRTSAQKINIAVRFTVVSSTPLPFP